MLSSRGKQGRAEVLKHHVDVLDYWYVPEKSALYKGTKAF